VRSIVRHRVCDSHQYREGSNRRLRQVWPHPPAVARHFDPGYSPDIAEQIGLPADYGVLIQRVLPAAPPKRLAFTAARSGQATWAYGGDERRDLIIAMDGQEIANTQDLPPP